MPGGFEELDQSVARNRRGAGILQGVKVEHGVRHHGRVEDDGHFAFLVVHHRKRRYRARLDAQKLAHRFRRSKRETPGGAKEPMQRFELDRRVFRRHDQEQAPFLVAQEQVLGEAANELIAIALRPRLFDREYRLVPHRLVGDAETIQIGEEVVRRGGRHVDIDIGQDKPSAGPMDSLTATAQVGAPKLQHLACRRLNSANFPAVSRIAAARGRAVAKRGALWHSFGLRCTCHRGLPFTDAGVAQG
jgi:hypothetical protein